MMNTHEWLNKLISFDTTSSHSNLELINTLVAWFSQQGLPTRLTHDHTGKKANLFATLPAQDGTLQGGILLSGHTDTVPVTGQSWDTPPFQATPIENRIYGRGACDMKGFLAVILALLPKWQQLPLKKPLHIAFSYDEEVGCWGAPQLIADFQQQGIHPAVCIVGEPTQMLPVLAHKGINVFHCKVTGQAAHSSLTSQGCNTIEYAAQLINYIRTLAEQFKTEGPFDTAFDVPYTSITTNLIQGGNAVNIIPAQCEFTFEFRHLPESNPVVITQQINTYIENQLLPKMQQVCLEAGIELDRIAAIPGLVATENKFIQDICALIGSNAKHKVSYATEAGLFQRAGIPTLICGPGSIEQAHKSNEFVTLEQLNQCETFLEKIGHYCSDSDYFA